MLLARTTHTHNDPYMPFDESCSHVLTHACTHTHRHTHALPSSHSVSTHQRCGPARRFAYARRMQRDTLHNTHTHTRRRARTWVNKRAFGHGAEARLRKSAAAECMAWLECVRDRRKVPQPPPSHIGVCMCVWWFCQHNNIDDDDDGDDTSNRAAFKWPTYSRWHGKCECTCVCVCVSVCVRADSDKMLLLLLLCRRARQRRRCGQPDCTMDLLLQKRVRAYGIRKQFNYRARAHVRWN